jgi:hypothetical protein
MPGTFFGQKSAFFAEGSSPYAVMDLPSPAAGNAHVQPTKLFIGGISRRTTTKQLRDHFSQSGRVLDCVAMRTPDGRPRGFGYVTLDSPAAAERFLMEPQMIDDRIVDLKRAVPEAQTPKSSGPSPTSLMGDHSTPLSMQAYYSPPGMFYPWADQFGFYGEGGCANRFAMPDMGLPVPGASAAFAEQAAMDCLDLLSPTAAPTGPLLPDCVDLLTGPLLAGPVTVGVENVAEPQEAPMPQPLRQAPPAIIIDAIEEQPEKAPLAEVTNVLGQSDIKKPSLALAPPLKVGLAYEPVPVTSSMLSPMGSLLSPMGSCGPCFIFEDPQEESVASTEPPSPANEGDLSPQPPSISLGDDLSPQPPSAFTTPTADTAADSTEGLPSIGSAQHASGECRRCNFFAKGRCRNGLDCSFCHLPHDRRKLSRQEKREQQATRQALRDAGLEAGSDSDSEADSTAPQQCGPLLSPAGARAPPGLGRAPPGLSLDAPAFEPSGALLTSMSTPAASAVPAAPLPPGLCPPGLPSPKLATAPVQGATLATFSWENAAAGMFSTSPCSSVGGVSSFLLSTTPSAQTVLAPAGLPKTVWKEMCTVATQTDDDFTCPHCEVCGDISLLLSASCACPPAEAPRDALEESSPPASPATQRRRRPRPAMAVLGAVGGA